MDRVFRILLKMHIHPGREADFERVWADNTGVVAAHPACRGQFLARSATEESTYYICSDWIDEAGFLEFEDSPEHLDHRQKLHPFRSRGAIRMMRTVPGLTG